MSSQRHQGTRPRRIRRGGAARCHARPGWFRTDAQGMTLGELAIILVLVGIVSAMASPYLLQARNEYRFDHGAREVLRGLQRARFEAVRRNESVAFSQVDATHFSVDGLGQFEIPNGVRFVSGPATIQFASFGPVVGGVAAPLVLSDGRRTKEIVINLSGYASLE